MKKDDIQLGGTYLAKVTDKVVEVRLDAENPHGGWDATNLATGKKVRIKSAQRLRGPATDPSTPATADAAPAEAKPAKVKKAKGTAEPKTKKRSGLDAAFEVLKAKGEPMNAQAMVDAMLAQGLWKTNGKTPAATIYSAILREIDAKPGESRFVKTDRGLFTIAAPRT